MTPEEQRIAIAEACPGRFKFFGGIGWHYGRDGEDWRRCIDGDILSDFNAMHEAEKVLTEKQIRSYAFILAQVLDTSPTVDLDDQVSNIHATAAQRAEAFLRTIGKWKEDTPS